MSLWGRLNDEKEVLSQAAKCYEVMGAMYANPGWGIAKRL